MVKEYPDRTVMKRQIKIMNKELEDRRVVMRQRQIQSQMLVDALQRYEIERQVATAAATPVTSPSGQAELPVRGSSSDADGQEGGTSTRTKILEVCSEAIRILPMDRDRCRYHVCQRFHSR